MILSSEIFETDQCSIKFGWKLQGGRASPFIKANGRVVHLVVVVRKQNIGWSISLAGEMKKRVEHTNLFYTLECLFP